jgi:hypothetical protein
MVSSVNLLPSREFLPYPAAIYFHIRTDSYSCSFGHFSHRNSCIRQEPAQRHVFDRQRHNWRPLYFTQRRHASDSFVVEIIQGSGLRSFHKITSARRSAALQHSQGHFLHKIVLCRRVFWSKPLGVKLEPFLKQHGCAPWLQCLNACHSLKSVSIPIPVGARDLSSILFRYYTNLVNFLVTLVLVWDSNCAENPAPQRRFLDRPGFAALDPLHFASLKSSQDGFRRSFQHECHFFDRIMLFHDTSSPSRTPLGRCEFRSGIRPSAVPAANQADFQSGRRNFALRWITLPPHKPASIIIIPKLIRIA